MFDPEIHHRRSIRLKNFDYSKEGAYYISLCTYNKEYLFGEIKNKEMILNVNGKAVDVFWHEIPLHYPEVELDEYIIMPNHIHGIIFINTADVQDFKPLRKKIPEQTNKYQHIIPGSIGSIIRGFKIGATKWFKANTEISPVWQRNYYEHIIRDDEDLNRIREYIKSNPMNWDKDDENIKENP